MRRRKQQGWQHKQHNLVPIIGMGLCGIILIGAVSLAMLADEPEVTMAKNYCLGEGSPGRAVLVDYSAGMWNAMQQRGVEEYFRASYEQMNGNERFAIYGTNGHTLSQIPRPVVEMCRPVRTGAESLMMGGPDLPTPFLHNKNRQAFRKVYWPHIQHMLRTDLKEDEKVWDSPLLEMTQSLSRLPTMTGKPFRKLVLVSDLMHNSDGVRFCYERGHLPSYQKFTTTRHWARLQPKPFTGVSVDILMLERNLEGTYCTETELIAFWTEYFEGNGATVEITRLRMGI